MSQPQQGDYWRNGHSPTRTDSSGSNSSSRDHSPTRHTGIARLVVNGTISGRDDLSKWPQNEAKEKEKAKRIAEKLQPSSPSKTNATPVKTNKKAIIPSTASDTASTATAADSTTGATATTSSTEATATSTATQTPKHKRKNNNNNNNNNNKNYNSEGQGSQQKSRKAPHNPAANTVTPLKKQEYYAGPAFANSPAPSSLPIPKFFLRQEAAKAAGDSPRSASASPAVHDTTNRSLTGLDMLFNADRKEKANKQHQITNSAVENHQVVGLTDEGWREYQSRELKNLLAGKPSTPKSKSAGPPNLQQYMSAPPQFQSRMPGPSSAAAPSLDYEPQPDNYYYGNRHLSPMFEAARQRSPHSDSSAVISKSIQPEHYRQPTSLDEQASWDKFPQYSPNPTKTAAYMPAVPAQNHALPIPEQLHAQAAKAKKEDAIRKMIGMN